MKSHRAFGLLLALPAAVLTATPGAESAPAVTPIQPGAHIGDFSPEYCRAICTGCTLNFVFEDRDGGFYIGTAGHCTTEVGERIMLAEDGSTVGEVVFRNIAYRDPVEDPLHNGPAWIHYFAEDPDFALIAIDPERYDDVSPAVRGWGGPAGVADASATAVGDVVYVYGQGAGMRQTGLQARAGVLLNHDEHMFEFAPTVSGGDSGSPIIHAPTGMALGHAHNFHNGPPLTRTLAALTDAGFDLELVTAPVATSAQPRPSLSRAIRSREET